MRLDHDSSASKPLAFVFPCSFSVEEVSRRKRAEETSCLSAKTGSMAEKENRGCETDAPVEHGHDGAGLVVSDVIKQVAAQDEPGKRLPA